MTTAPITIPNTLPPAIVALASETLDQIARLESQAAVIPATITDVAQMRAADLIVGEVIRLDKAIEAERKRLKKPILDLAEALDMASSEARTPLIGIKADLGRAILAFQAEENRRREEARRVMEEERRRQEAEAAAALVAALEAQRQAEQAATEAAPWDDAPAATAAPVHVPEVIPPSYQDQVAVAPLKSASVVRKVTKKVQIVDPSKVPPEVGGVGLWIIDTKAVERLAKAGVSIPGVEVIEVETLAAKG